MPSGKPPRIVYVDSPKERAEEAPPRENFLSLSLLPLVRPFFQFGYERRIHPRIGLGGAVGLGIFAIGKGADRFGFALGPQVNFYAVGNFTSGMPVGVELLYMASRDSTSGGAGGIRITSSSFNPALTIGYKVETKIGITLSAHIGLRFVRSSVTVKDAESQASNSASSFEPLVRVSVGYSF
jgi:hypothetical protein